MGGSHCLTTVESGWDLHILLWHWGGVRFQGYQFGRTERELQCLEESMPLTTPLWWYLYFISYLLTLSRSVVNLLPAAGWSLWVTVLQPRPCQPWIYQELYFTCFTNDNSPYTSQHNVCFFCNSATLLTHAGFVIRYNPVSLPGGMQAEWVGNIKSNLAVTQG